MGKQLEKRNRILLLLRVILAASGVLWLAFGITGEGSALLTGWGILDLLTLSATFWSRGSTWLWSLVMATSLSNFTLYIYQAYAAYSLLQIRLSQTPITAFLIDISGSVLFALLILRLYARPDELSMVAAPKTSEEGRTSKG